MDATLLANSSQYCWMLQVASFCTSSCMLLGVVPVKPFSQQLPTFLLFRDCRSIEQQHWIHLYGSSNTVGAANVHFTTVYKDFWVVSFPLCTRGPNIVGSSCIHLHTTADTDPPTPNFVGQLHLFAAGALTKQCLPTMHVRRCLCLDSMRGDCQGMLDCNMLHVLKYYYYSYYLNSLSLLAAFCDCCRSKRKTIVLQ